MLAHCVHIKVVTSPAGQFMGPLGSMSNLERPKKHFYSMYFFGLSNVKCALEIMFIILFYFYNSYDVIISFYILKLAHNFKLALF